MKSTSKKVVTKLMLATALAFFFNVSNAQKGDQKSLSLLDNLVSVTGGYKALASKKDVQFNYVYDNFEKGKDVSLERHIFGGEHSWGSYKQHDLNVLPKEKGIAVQALIDGKPALTLDGKTISDDKALGGTIFLRRVNFYWFTMLYKLQDEGTNYNYLGTEKVNGVLYDKVSLKYDAAITKKEKNDAYILYFNPKTHLIDLFYFSLPDFGINEPILRMTMAYEIIDGIYIPVVRKSYGPDKHGKYQLGGEYTFSNIKFNNGFKSDDFKL